MNQVAQHIKQLFESKAFALKRLDLAIQCVWLFGDILKLTLRIEHAHEEFKIK
jgi:hypothetical protein